MSDATTNDIWVCADGYDLSGHSREAVLTVGQEIVNYLCYNGPGVVGAVPTQKRVITGYNPSFALAGYQDMVNVDPVLRGVIGLTGKYQIGGYSRALGDWAYILRILTGEYKSGGAASDVGAYTMATVGDQYYDGLNGAYADVTATNVIGGIEHGAVLAAQSLRLNLQVQRLTGTATFDAIWETDADNTFASAITRHTFTQIAAVGSQHAVVAGAITDTWGRLSYTITGTGTFRVRLVASVAAT